MKKSHRIYFSAAFYLSKIKLLSVAMSALWLCVFLFTPDLFAQTITSPTMNNTITVTVVYHDSTSNAAVNHGNNRPTAITNASFPIPKGTTALRLQLWGAGGGGAYGGGKIVGNCGLAGYDWGCQFGGGGGGGAYTGTIVGQSIPITSYGVATINVGAGGNNGWFDDSGCNLFNHTGSGQLATSGSSTGFTFGAMNIIAQGGGSGLSMTDHCIPANANSANQKDYPCPTDLIAHGGAGGAAFTIPSNLSGILESYSGGKGGDSQDMNADAIANESGAGGGSAGAWAMCSKSLLNFGGVDGQNAGYPVLTTALGGADSQPNSSRIFGAGGSFNAYSSNQANAPGAFPGGGGASGTDGGGGSSYGTTSGWGADGQAVISYDVTFSPRLVYSGQAPGTITLTVLDTLPAGITATYTWYKIDGNGTLSVLTGNSKTITDTSNPSPGKFDQYYATACYTVSYNNSTHVQVLGNAKVNANNISYTADANTNIVQVSTILSKANGGSAMIWSGAANDGIWGNSANWEGAHAPNSNNDAVIPGNLPAGTRFPMLSSSVTVRNIYIMSGGEIGRPDFLTYDSVYVQYFVDYGKSGTNTSFVSRELDAHNYLSYSSTRSIPNIIQEQWNMLSMPLPGIVSGDLAFGFYPATFLMKFQPATGTHPTAGWSDYYRDYAEPIGALEGFGFNMYGNLSGALGELTYGSGADAPYFPNARVYGLDSLFGVIEFPHHDSPYMVEKRRIHSFDGTTSSFYWVNTNDGTLTGQSSSVTRNAAFGKLYSDFGSNPLMYNYSGIDPTSIIMLGNPWISSIDFDQFHSDNSALIRNFYWWFDGTSFQSYSVSGGGGTSSSRLIPAMSAFFVQLANPPGNRLISFDVRTLSTTRTPNGNVSIRSEQASSLRIDAKNAWYNSSAYIVVDENGSSSFVLGLDVPKLFTFANIVGIPEVFTVADEYALSYNFIGQTTNVKMPVGIKSNYITQTELKISNIQNLNAKKIEFIDMNALSPITDITNKESFTYNFMPASLGMNEGRFFLNIIMDIELSNYPPICETASHILIFGSDSKIQILSTASDLIREVHVYDVQGRKLYEKSNLNDSMYKIDSIFENKLLIVKVVSDSNTKTDKIILL